MKIEILNIYKTFKPNDKTTINLIFDIASDNSFTNLYDFFDTTLNEDGLIALCDKLDIETNKKNEIIKYNFNLFNTIIVTDKNHTKNVSKIFSKLYSKLINYDHYHYDEDLFKLILSIAKSISIIDKRFTTNIISNFENKNHINYGYTSNLLQAIIYKENFETIKDLIKVKFSPRNISFLLTSFTDEKMKMLIQKTFKNELTKYKKELQAHIESQRESIQAIKYQALLKEQELKKVRDIETIIGQIKNHIPIGLKNYFDFRDRYGRDNFKGYDEYLTKIVFSYLDSILNIDFTKYSYVNSDLKIDFIMYYVLKYCSENDIDLRKYNKLLADLILLIPPYENSFFYKYLDTFNTADLDRIRKISKLNVDNTDCSYKFLFIYLLHIKDYTNFDLGVELFEFTFINNDKEIKGKIIDYLLLDRLKNKHFFIKHGEEIINYKSYLNNDIKAKIINCLIVDYKELEYLQFAFNQYVDNLDNDFSGNDAERDDYYFYKTEWLRWRMNEYNDKIFFIDFNNLIEQSLNKIIDNNYKLEEFYNDIFYYYSDYLKRLINENHFSDLDLVKVVKGKELINIPEKFELPIM